LLYTLQDNHFVQQGSASDIGESEYVSQLVLPAPFVHVFASTYLLVFSIHWCSIQKSTSGN